MIIDEFAHVSTRLVPDEEDDEAWIEVGVSETVTILGRASDVQRWADELQLKVRTT